MFIMDDYFNFKERERIVVYVFDVIYVRKTAYLKKLP